MNRSRQQRLESRRARRGEGGSFLIVAALFLTFVLSLVLSALTVVSSRVKDVRHSRNQLIARHAAASGVQQAIATLHTARDFASLVTAFGGIDNLDTNPYEGPSGYTQVYAADPLTDQNGATIAEFDVFADIHDRTSFSRRRVDFSCYAYVPSKAAFANGETDAARSDAHVTVTAEIDGGNVFDYAYFINHWGWFFGDTIVSNGNVRSNGQFDFGGYASTINGSPRYLGSSGTQLLGYLDDNEDGITDGTDGGAYSGMAIVNDADVRGMGALLKNQHEFQESISMPNLSDLSYYENQATSTGGTLAIGSTTYVNGVLGDEVGEKQHLYLVGTAASPIVINGTVVVRGSVIISGVVTGKGAIYSGDNVYIPKNLQYLNGPTTSRPASNDQATVEAWRAANQSKDALGLFAREHVVISNYTNSSWQSYVSGWVNHSLNKSSEDAGIDGIHNTRAGMDGALGTEDDDTLEGDGVWSVMRYTSADAALGLIPAGKSVGDVVPGSGEDIDGDGAYDPTTVMSEFNLPATLSSTNWAGNAPATTTAYSAVSTLDVSRIDAALYTNHTLAALMIHSGSDINFNGSIVSRNESIIYSAPNINMNHDERLTGEGGAVFGFNNPIAWEPLVLSDWEYDRDLGSILADPAQIAAYYAP